MLSHSSAVDNFGGAERSMVEFLDEWRAAEPKLELFVISRSPSGLLQPALDERGIPWMNLPFTSVVRHRRSTDAGEIYESARLDFAAIRAIERFIREYRADLVVTNTIVAPWAAIASRLVPVPHVWFVREYGDGHEFQIPHEDVFTDIGILSDLVVTNSEALRDHIAQWIEPQKITVAYPALEATRSREIGSSDVDVQWPIAGERIPGSIRLVCVGRISPSKGQARLVRALALLRDSGVHAEAVFVGSATESDRRALEMLVEDLDVGDRVALTGERLDPRPIVDLADAGVVVSDSEGFGRVTVEYMSAGKPVIGAAVGATVELIDHDVTGRLFTLDDPESLAQAIDAYVTHPESLVAHGRAAVERLRDDISQRHRPAELIPRLSELTRAEPQPLTSLPRVMHAWFALPEIVVDLLFSSGAMVDPTTSRTWKIGHAALAVPRFVARAARRRGVQR